MTLQPGMRVRIIKSGLLAGQEGTITSVSAPLLTVELDVDETLVMLGVHEVQALPNPTATASDGCVQVQLPQGLPLQVCGHAVEAVVCIVRMPAQLRAWLQQQTGQQFPDAMVQASSGPVELPPWAGQAGMPFNSVPAGWGPQPPAAAVPPVRPVPVATGNLSLPTPGEATRLQMARHLVEMFLHMRMHTGDAMGPPAVPGDEWKQLDDDEEFSLTEPETRLYGTCCDVLTTFLQPMCGPIKKSPDSVDG